MHKYIGYFFGHLGIAVSAVTILLFAFICCNELNASYFNKCIVTECESTYMMCVINSNDRCKLYYSETLLQSNCDTYNSYHWVNKYDCTLYDPTYHQLTNMLTNRELFAMLFTLSGVILFYAILLSK